MLITTTTPVQIFIYENKKKNQKNVFLFTYRLFPQSTRIPHTNCLIQTGRHDQIVGRMKRSTHDVVVVSRQHTNTFSTLPIPDTYRLIVGRGNDPWMYFVKFHGANVVEMAQQREQTTALLVVPHFNFVVVTTTDKQRLLQMKINCFKNQNRRTQGANVVL